MKDDKGEDQTTQQQCMKGTHAANMLFKYVIQICYANMRKKLQPIRWLT